MFLCHIANTLCYQHSLSGSAKVKPFDPKVTCKQECLITTFQEVYFVSESFEEAKEKMRYGIFVFPCHIKAGLTAHLSGAAPNPFILTKALQLSFMVLKC